MNVAILKPHEASKIDQEAARTLFEAGGADHRTRDTQTAEHVIREVKELIADVADRIKLRVRVKEYPAYYNESHQLVTTFADALDLMTHDMTVIIDPPKKELAFAATSNGNPLRRVLAAFSEKELLEAKFDALGQLRVPLVDSQDENKLNLAPRAFGVHVPTYLDDAARAYEQNRNVVEQALLYPRNSMVVTDRAKYFAIMESKKVG